MFSLATALRRFAARVAELDVPPAPPVVAVRIGDEEPVALTPSAVAALTTLLDEFQDPRASGDCDNCGGRRIDRNFICMDCGHASGVFGQLLREHSARYPGDPQSLPPS